MVRASSLELGCRDLDSHLGLRIFSVLSGDQIEKMAHNLLGVVAILPSFHKNGRRPMMMSCCSSFLTSLPTPPCQMIPLFPFFGVKSYDYIYIALSDCPIP